VTFGGDAIAKSPFSVGVAAPLDLSKVTLDDLEGRKSSGPGGLVELFLSANINNTIFCLQDRRSIRSSSSWWAPKVQEVKVA